MSPKRKSSNLPHGVFRRVEQREALFHAGPADRDGRDVIGIAELAYKIIQEWKANAANKKRGLSINLATAYFVPKPFTPFQWEAQITPEEYLRRVHLLQENIHSRSIDYRYHESNLSQLEAVLARGDRRLGPVLLAAQRLAASSTAGTNISAMTSGCRRSVRWALIRCSIRRAALARTKFCRGARSPSV